MESASPLEFFGKEEGEGSDFGGGEGRKKKSFVSAVAWVRRGVAKAIPDKVEIRREDLRDLIQGHVDETTEDEEEEEKDEQPKISGLRGSATSESVTREEEKGGMAKYRLEDYDIDGIASPENSTLRGLACFTSPLEDPHITRHQNDEDEVEEREDFELKPNDNLLVVAKVVREEEASLEVHVWNEERDDWYLHHDYLLEAPPLCLATFTHDPGADNGRGNLVAVGTMDPTISVWDLDIVNAVKPVLALGSRPSKSRRRFKRDGTAQGHSDAVLCLDWNQLAEHVLASGSADRSLILWDLDEAKATTVIGSLNAMIQSCEWHPKEASILAVGTRSGDLAVLDCRDNEPSVCQWKLPAASGAPSVVEVEAVTWSHSDPGNGLISASDDGMLHYIDIRKPGEFLSHTLAHEGGVISLSQSYSNNNLLASIGSKEMKIWQVGKGEADSLFHHVHTQPIQAMGQLNVVRFCPDSTYVVAVGAHTEEMVRLIDLANYSEVVKNFFDPVASSRMEE